MLLKRCVSSAINNVVDDDFVRDLMREYGHYWIGLNDQAVEGTFVWQDGSTPNYTNWQSGQPDQGSRANCGLKSKNDGRWKDGICGIPRKFVCSMPATNSCGTAATSTAATSCASLTTTSTTTPATTTTIIESLATNELVTSVVENAVNKRICILSENEVPENEVSDDQEISNSELPNVDVFINPSKETFKKEVVKEKKGIAEKYFNNVDNMQSLYPELFRILWESTLPCFETPGKDEHMLLSCQLAGVEVNCSDLFTKVPTDTGMCCALNTLDPLKNSTYQRLVKELQDETTTKTRVKSEEGQRNGLRLTLDLHSNTVSFGTLDQDYEGFNVFIGHPAEFPMTKKKILQVEPGREHFIDLSAVVVSTKDIKDITPEARECFFEDEGDLDFYKSYTFSNCRLECAIKKLEPILECVPWHLPRV